MTTLRMLYSHTAKAESTPQQSHFMFESSQYRLIMEIEGQMCGDWNHDPH